MVITQIPMGAQASHEASLKEAEKANPAAKVPRIRDISPRTADKCDADPDNYYCRKLEKAMYWLENAALHKDNDFRRAYGTFGKMYPIDEKQQVESVYYSINHLFDTEHPAIVNAVHKEFKDYYKMQDPE